MKRCATIRLIELVSQLVFGVCFVWEDWSTRTLDEWPGKTLQMQPVWASCFVLLGAGLFLWF